MLKLMIIFGRHNGAAGAVVVSHLKGTMFDGNPFKKCSMAVVVSWDADAFHQ